MPILVLCPSCGTKLKVPDNWAGRRAKCAKCGGLVSVQAAAAVDAAFPTGPKQTAVQDDRDFEEKGPETLRFQETPDAKPRPEPERPRKRKRRTQRERRAAGGFPEWAWWLCILAGLFILIAVAAVLGIAAGYAGHVFGAIISLVIFLPIGAVLLMLSMLISSAVAGGIDFGELHVAIMKALVLLIVVNLVSLVGLWPLGWGLTLATWFFGFMYLFKLDMWESRLLVIVNWALNTVAQILLLAFVMSILSQGSGDGRKHEQPPPGSPAPQKQEDRRR